MTQPDGDGASPTPNRESAESFRAKILDSLYDGVYFVDRARRITYWNRGAERLTGYSSEEAVGSFCFDNMLSHVDGMGCQLCTSRCPLVTAIEQDRLLEDDVYLRHKEGHRLPVSVRVAPIKDDDGQIVGAVEVFSDKWTHSTGDTVLRIVAATLSHNLRSPDIAGRWGGDEFLAIVSDITFDDLVELCERCRNFIAQSAVAAGDERISVSVSIGATMLRLGETADDAINRADQLMYQSKATRNQSTVA